MTIMLTIKRRRVGVAALAAAAVVALTFGGASAASAVSGTSNQGLTDVKVTPLNGAVNFDTPGTEGVLTFSMGSGAPDTNQTWSLNVGDRSAYQFNLDPGLRFLGSNPVCPTDLYSFADTECELSADQRQWIVRSIVHTPVTNSPIGWAGTTGPNWLVVSTGTDPVPSPAGSAVWTRWYEPGSQSTAQPAVIALNVTPANPTPLLAGGIIAALGLAGTGVVYGVRRRRAAA